MSDQFIYEDVAQSQEDFEPFVRKQLIYTAKTMYPTTVERFCWRLPPLLLLGCMRISEMRG